MHWQATKGDVRQHDTIADCNVPDSNRCPMMIDAGNKTPQATEQPQTPPPATTLPATTPQFKDTFIGSVLLSVTVAVVTAYVTAALIKRRGGA